ncbi:hypothetical protein ScPMuIL_008358 [Solemya velum]
MGDKEENHLPSAKKKKKKAQEPPKKKSINHPRKKVLLPTVEGSCLSSTEVDSETPIRHTADSDAAGNVYF